MENRSEHRVVDAERLGDGVIITFDDGKSAVYSASLLQAIFTQAQEVNEQEPDE
jgi:hypothetical protein